MSDHDDDRCLYCGESIYWSDHHDAWNLTYRLSAHTTMCHERSDGAVLSSLPHEPVTQ
jgi:hypothetical protein